jgi:hypothetical protein
VRERVSERVEREREGRKGIVCVFVSMYGVSMNGLKCVCVCVCARTSVHLKLFYLPAFQTLI